MVYTGLDENRHFKLQEIEVVEANRQHNNGPTTEIVAELGVLANFNAAHKGVLNVTCD